MKYLSRLALLLALSSLFTLSLNAKELDIKAELKKYQGQVIYLDFWASWCGPCRKSFPWMNEMQTKYGDKGLTVLSINLDADKANADEFLAEIPASFPVLFDPAGKTARLFKVKGMPSSYLFDKTGQLISSHVGFFQEKTAGYEKEIEEALAQ